MRRFISFCYAHARLVLVCICASNFDMRMRISFEYANAVSRFGMRIGMSWKNIHLYTEFIKPGARYLLYCPKMPPLHAAENSLQAL